MLQRCDVEVFVLSSGSEEQTPIGRKGEPTEEGCKGLVGIQTGALDIVVVIANTADAGRSGRHHSW